MGVPAASWWLAWRRPGSECQPGPLTCRALCQRCPSPVCDPWVVGPSCPTENRFSALSSSEWVGLQGPLFEKSCLYYFNAQK